MRIIKSFIIAFAMYSKIPVPKCEWKEEDMKYVFCFFPLVGVVTGALVFAWNYLCFHMDFPEILRICITGAIPIMITGGIHIDGFMDTMDALHSYRDREKKLEILKDPHIGAFSVIMLLLYSLICLGAMALVSERDAVAVFCIVFVLARCLSGLGAIGFKSAKEGTLRLLARSSSGMPVFIVLVLESLICLAGMAFLNPFMAAGILVTALLTAVYYYLKTKKEFGGVTGDTAGFFLLILERNSLIVIAVISVISELLVRRI